MSASFSRFGGEQEPATSSPLHPGAWHLARTTRRFEIRFKLFVVVALALGCLPAARAAWAAPLYRLAAPGLIAAVPRGHRVFLLKEATLAAHALVDGARLYQITLEGPLSSRKLAVGRDYLYLLEPDWLRVYAIANGAPVHRRRLHRGISILATDKGVLVADSQGVYRLGPRGKLTLGLAKATGRIEGKDGDRLLLFSTRGRARLIVIDLEGWREVYRFKLLAGGSHQVVGFSGGKLAFFRLHPA